MTRSRAQNVDGSHNDIELLNGFLNPASFKDVPGADVAAGGGDMGAAGAGAIIMGLSDQVGNELDEFVADTLRNNLLGLPLDLATLNMTRARSEGIPSLNNVRKQIFAETNDGQLTPYTNWVDFGLHLKHPESLVNFVAAYGQHPSILSETTLAGKRNAARIIVNPEVGEVPPADAADFMESSGAWANAAGVSSTGLDLVDLWVGGLAENTNLFGGLLGSTFNYVFELQLTQLQDDDRLYYLNRTPGMNLRTQLEGNSFAELVMRNTTASALKADSFATADCKFQLANIVSPATSGAILGSGSIQDDPTSECNENALLIKVSGQIRYRAINSVDPPGINGQSVYNGTSGTDRVVGGNDNDTFRGNEGADVIDGNGGDDDSLGGDGNDIITDFAGDDVLKGGPGNDALDGGIGLDLLLGGDGNDLTAGGANTNVHFAGPGDDFIIGGQGADEVDGDSGDDFMEGGEQTDLLQGDSGSLFFDDHNKPGNDVLIGQAGDDDYDMEGGDDIGVAGPGIEKNAGAAGYDWSIGLNDPQPQDADLALPVIGVPLPINQVRDRFNEVEALSGWNLDDTLHGDDVVPSQVGGGGFIGCDALDADGVGRIVGLDQLVPTAIRTVPSGPIVAASATNHCPLTGSVWGEGNILLGGGGSDLIEGRGADDIIDGDRYLSVRLSVRTNPSTSATEIGSTDLLEHQARSGSFGAGTTGMTLQQAVFAGLVDPGNIVVVRELLTNATGSDTALFSGPMSNYTIDFNAGSIVVTQTGANVAGQKASDGADTLRNIEALRFSDQTVVLSPPAAPAIGTATALEASARVTWTPPAVGTLPITSFDVETTSSGGSSIKSGIGATQTSNVVAGLTPGTSYTFRVRAWNAVGAGAWSGVSNAVVPTAPLVPPAAPTGVTATAGVISAVVTWVAPVPNGGPPVSSYEIVPTPGTVADVTGIAPGSTSATVTGLTAGTSYTFQVRAVNADGPGLLSAPSNAVTPTALAVPARPTGATAVAGNTTVSLSWTDGAQPVASHLVQIRVAGVVQSTLTVPGAGNATVITGLTNGTAYTFRIAAVNAAGTSAFSPASNAATPATVPNAPVIGIAAQGPAGGALTAVATWAAPASTGGSRILGYTVTARPRPWWVARRRPSPSGRTPAPGRSRWRPAATPSGWWRSTRWAPALHRRNPTPSQLADRPGSTSPA